MLKWFRKLFNPVTNERSEIDSQEDSTPAPRGNSVVEHARKTADRYEELLGEMAPEDRAQIEQIEEELCWRKHHSHQLMAALENKRREMIKEQADLEAYEQETKALRAQIVPLVARSHAPTPLPEPFKTESVPEIPPIREFRRY